MDYKTSGVDVEAGRSFVNQIRKTVESTSRKEVIGGIGGFGGCIRLPEGYKKPVLVAGTDGVGTKLELAQDHGSHFGVGIDLVAMCVNDVITNGAEPLFFLDYVATGKLGPQALVDVINGISYGCRQCNCALLGGETAEMPGFYSKGRYDLAGFCVAVVEQDKIIDGHKIHPGDKIIGIESSGIHSNGFSLVRQIVQKSAIDLKRKNIDLSSNLNLLDVLLKPTHLYVSLVKSFFKNKLSIHGMAHITGGGLPENLPRCFPKGLRPKLNIGSWEIPEIFRWLQVQGNIPEADLWNTFNLGIGFCVIIPPDQQEKAIQICLENSMKAWKIGEVEESNESSLGGLSHI